jgi:hypothetical protein
MEGGNLEYQARAWKQLQNTEMKQSSTDSEDIQLMHGA